MTERTIPQAVNTSGGQLPNFIAATRARMTCQMLPKQTSLKSAQFACLRELKLNLDKFLNPAASMLLAYGITATPFQSVIYNQIIADTYKFHLGAGKAATLSEIARGM